MLMLTEHAGLGRALAEAYLSRPSHTVVAGVRDVNSAMAASLKDIPTAQDSSVMLVRLNSTSDTDTHEAVEAMQAAGINHLDIVIANAGIAGAYSRIESLELRDMLKRQDEMTDVLMPTLENATPGAGTYLNEADFRTPDWQEEFYGENWPRLSAIKKKYDPSGLLWARTAVGSEEWVESGDGRLCRV